MKSQLVIQSKFLLIMMLLSSMVYSQRKENRIFDDSAIKISEIGINSIHSDFGPSIIQDTLYFTTFNDKLFGKSDQKLKKKEFYDLYKARIDPQGNNISEREPVPSFITRYNDGPVSWCDKTGELFVTQNYSNQSAKQKSFQKTINRLKIIIAKRINGKWEIVKEFPFNNPEYSVGHPAITDSGDTLVFSSDRPGGYGETDLYCSVRKNGEWETPVNLGPRINSPEKEEFAFLTDQSFNGRYLVFSSKERGGNGGFDLYYTRFPSDYSEIIRFDGPINSTYDDFAMTIPPNTEFGYMTSNRPGTGSDDIYKFNFKRKKGFRRLYVFDNNTIQPISGARIVSCDKQAYMTDAAGEIASLPCLETNCEVSANAIGYTEKTKILLACMVNHNKITRDTIWMDMITDQKIVLNNIYYDFDKWDILPESAAELDRLVLLMKENLEMKVELSSHTDDRGTRLYNLKLSQLRAQAAVDYIISKEIDRTRITGKVYGKSQLINKCAEPCTPAQHRENRRTELYIPGFLRGKPVKQEKGDYSNGKFNHASGYSSFKEHGSLFGKVTNMDIQSAGASKFYLILGSFISEVRALNLVHQLKAEGYEATSLKDSKTIKVGIVYQSFNQAMQGLEKLKNKYEHPWIMQDN